MIRWMTISLLVTAALPIPAQGQSNDVPGVVRRGFDALRPGGYLAALDEWTKGWTTPQAGERRRALETELEPVLTSGGPVRLYDLLASTDDADGARHVYATIVHDDIAMYVDVVARWAGSDWQITDIRVSHDAKQVLPPALLAPSKSRS